MQLEMLQQMLLLLRALKILEIKQMVLELIHTMNMVMLLKVLEISILLMFLMVGMVLQRLGVEMPNLLVVIMFVIQIIKQQWLIQIKVNHNRKDCVIYSEWKLFNTC